MSSQRVVAVVLLVAALFALGTLSASLSSTVTSSPNDAIDIESNSLPFVGEGASDIARSYERAENGPVRRVDSPSEDPASADGGGKPEDGADSSDRSDDRQSDPAANPPNADPANEDPAANPSNADPANEGPADGASDRSDTGEQGGDGGQERGKKGGTGSGPSDGLWALLQQLLRALLALLALAALLAAGLLVARRREQLLDRLRALAARYGLWPSGGAGGEVAVPDGVGEAATVVERAWGEMVARSSADPAPGDTPRECMRAVVDAGADPDAAEKLTALYERVRYGDGSITPADASRALGALREVAPADAEGLPGVDDPASRGSESPNAAGGVPADGFDPAATDAGEGRA